MSGYIKKRKTKDGKPRYLVYYRRGGRRYKTVYAGSFEKKREAETRRDLIAGELAAGRDPKHLLASLLHPDSQVGLEQRWDEFIKSRIDVGESATSLYGNAKARWVPLLGASTDPHTVTVDQIQRGIAELTEPSDKSVPALKPNTILQYTSTLRQVLDFCDVVPNPARHRRLRLPSQAKDEIAPPSTKEWLAVYDHLRVRSRDILELCEACGFRIGEVVKLEYPDIDFVDGRIRVARARTKTAAGRRWVDIPDELLAKLDGRRAPEDRVATPRVFLIDPSSVQYDLRVACASAGVAAFTPHQLRHRRISLWIRMGIDSVTLSRWAGHAKASMSLDTYGHVMVDPSEDRWRTFWLSVYGNERRRTPVAEEVEA